MKQKHKVRSYRKHIPGIMTENLLELFQNYSTAKSSSVLACLQGNEHQFSTRPSPRDVCFLSWHNNLMKPKLMDDSSSSPAAGAYAAHRLLNIITALRITVYFLM